MVGISQAYYNRAVVQRELQQFDRALEDFARMVQIDPENAVGYYNRGLYPLRNASV